jgi:hypothetical protein
VAIGGTAPATSLLRMKPLRSWMPEERPPGDTAMARGAEEVTATGCDTARVLALLTTLVGLLAVLAGIGCGATAYSRTHAEHADVPLWPAMHRAGQAICRVWVRYVLRRPGVTVSVSGAASAAVTSSATVVASGPEIDTDLPVEEQVRFLIHHVKNIENQASSDRSRFARGHSIRSRRE